MIISKLVIDTPSGPIYMKFLTFLIRCINDVFDLYSRQHTSSHQLLNESKKINFFL